ncbi:MAG: hypothetical protein PG977_000187 [Bartonella clarridgeiae]|nr:MAG: hypothetical protein PG977_000187 [Bartonella clarridgeiae]
MFQLSNHEDIKYKDCKVLFRIMGMIEKALITKLQDEMPNAIKILTIMRDF